MLNAGGRRLTLYSLLLVGTLIGAVLITTFQGRRLAVTRERVLDLRQTVRGLNALSDAHPSAADSIVAAIEVDRPRSWAWATETVRAGAAMLETLRDGEWVEAGVAVIPAGRNEVWLRIVESARGGVEAELRIRPLTELVGLDEPSALESLELDGRVEELLRGDRVEFESTEGARVDQETDLLSCQADGAAFLRLRLVLD